MNESAVGLVVLSDREVLAAIRFSFLSYFIYTLVPH